MDYWNTNYMNALIILQTYEIDSLSIWEQKMLVSSLD